MLWVNSVGQQLDRRFLAPSGETAADMGRLGVSTGIYKIEKNKKLEMERCCGVDVKVTKCGASKIQSRMNTRSSEALANGLGGG